jgi:integrase
MGFSTRIILAQHQKEDGTRRVYLQAIIDRKRAAVAFDFYVREKEFDAKAQRVRSSHPNAGTYNKEILKKITEANNIASRFRLEDKQLTPRLFKEEFKHPSTAMDLLRFMKEELELKRPTIADSTWKNHNTLINKLSSIRSYIRFGDVNIELVQKLRNKLIKDGNKPSTINNLLKIFKGYIKSAREKGYKVEDPFKAIKIKTFRSNRVGLSLSEVRALEKYYDSAECRPSHHKLLRYFLFSCYTGVRISDIGLITWNQIHDDVLMFIPHKTRKDDRLVIVPLLEHDKKFLPEYRPGPIFDTYSNPVTNRYLKKIAAAVGIKKHITYHTSRHTFASLFAEGGDIQALQRMLGHGSIRTTMEYAKLSTKALIEAKRKWWNSLHTVQSDSRENIEY